MNIYVNEPTNTELPPQTRVAPTSEMRDFLINAVSRQQQVRFTGIDFSGADLHNLDLTNLVFSGCDMSHADLSGSTLTETSFRGSVLDYANLVGVIACRADFEDSHANAIEASDANFTGANFTDAIVTISDDDEFMQVNFTDANLSRMITCASQVHIFVGGPDELVTFETVERD